MIRRLSALSAGVTLAALSASSASADPLPDRAAFRTPPAEARPKTLYFWMNGNVTREGIDADLAAMRDAGLGGLLVFDGSSDIPKGPVDYLSPKWLDLMTHMMKRGGDLGLTVAMQNAPGWSSSGGPWISPAQAMQQIVWTETTVAGGRRITTKLPQPYTKLGFYRDAIVVAYPASSSDESVWRDAIAKVSVAGRDVSAATVTDRDLHSTVEITPATPLVIETRASFTARAVTLYADKEQPAFSATVEASDDGEAWRTVTRVSIGAERGIEAPGTVNFAATPARFFRITPNAPAKLAEALFYAEPRLADWDIKAEHGFRALPANGVEEDAAATAAPAIDPATVIDLTTKVTADGTLDWRAPKGRWTILRLGHTPTGKLNVAASDSGRGLEVDKFDVTAVDHQFDSSLGRVLAAADPQARAAFKRVEIDSYEAGLQNWSDGVPAAFAKRNGYAMTAFAPALAGRVVGSVTTSDRYLFDFRRTLADLMADNYYGRMEQRVREAGLEFTVEGYGPGPFDELQVSGRVQYPMTEFWTRTPWTDNRSVKMVSSAAHVYGKDLVAAEAFTGEAETSRWQDYPYAMKALGDLMFAQGVNRLYFHRYAMQPNPKAVPGMTMGPWGINLDASNTWFKSARPWLDTLARSQYLLGLGHHAADVLYFVGEDSPNQAEYVRPDISPDSNPRIGTHFTPAMPAGYQYDFVNAEVLLKAVTVRDGRIVLPNGASYRMLVLPDGLKGMTRELADRLRGLVSQGLVLLGERPKTLLSLAGGAAAEAAFRNDVAALWGETTTPRNVGKGRVYAGGTIAGVLGDLGVGLDADCRTASPDGQVVWQHRSLADGDMYFVANRQRRPETVTCSFRVADNAPELWNPEDGSVTAPAVYDGQGGRTRVSFALDPAGSTFVMLRKPGAAGASWAARDGTRFADLAATPNTGPGPADTFTLSVWAKPDIDLRLMPAETIDGRINETGKFYVVNARSGADLRGPGTAVAGLAVGRNGAYVIERVSGKVAPAVLVSHHPIAGWTHFALVYDHGTPRLYINGVLAKTGLKSGRTVYAGGGDAPSPSGVTYFFEGDNAPVTTLARALSAAEIAAIAAKGPPAPPIAVEPAIIARKDAGLSALVFETGHYTLSSGQAFAASVPPPAVVAGGWTVAFEPGRGAPATAVLPKLESLSHNEVPGIRYFSGTATYRRQITVPAAAIKAGRRTFLDLGRVENLAHVTVNGHDLGIVWKAPFRVDITDVMRVGANDVSIAVTDLWPNRLIGDAQKPDPYYRVDAEWPIGERFAADGSRTEVMAKKLVTLPEWYRAGEAKPDDGRVTFATWSFFQKDEPLLDSGLLGPVRLVFADVIDVR